MEGGVVPKSLGVLEPKESKVQSHLMVTVPKLKQNRTNKEGNRPTGSPCSLQLPSFPGALGATGAF